MAEKKVRQPIQVVVSRNGQWRFHLSCGSREKDIYTDIFSVGINEVKELLEDVDREVRPVNYRGPKPSHVCDFCQRIHKGPLEMVRDWGKERSKGIWAGVCPKCKGKVTPFPF